MAAERMAPRRTERDEHAAARFEQRAHLPQNRRRICKMLERVEAHDDVNRLAPGFFEDAAICDARSIGARLRLRQPLFTNIESDHVRRAPLRHLHRFEARPAPEIEDRAAGASVPDGAAAQALQLAAPDTPWRH